MAVTYVGTRAGEATAASAVRQPPLRLACIASCAATAQVVRDVLALAFPGATVTVEDPTYLRQVPDAHAVVVDGVVGDQPGVDVARDLRAWGFTGAIVLIAPAVDDLLRQRAARLGIASTVAPADLARTLGERVAASLPDASMDDVAAHAWAELRRTQQLLAAGEIAVRLQHALANPLTALLAEAQLLEMEELPPELRGSVERILEQCRRTIAVARRLDNVGAGQR